MKIKLNCASRCRRIPFHVFMDAFIYNIIFWLNFLNPCPITREPLFLFKQESVRAHAPNSCAFFVCSSIYNVLNLYEVYINTDVHNVSF